MPVESGSVYKSATSQDKTDLLALSADPVRKSLPVYVSRIVGMAPRAFGFARVSRREICWATQDVLPLGADPQMGRIHTAPVPAH